jgi:hypothetical protein
MARRPSRRGGVRAGAAGRQSGCLYYSTASGRFVIPEPDASLEAQRIVPHSGQPGGVLPRIAGERIDGAG